MTASFTSRPATSASWSTIRTKQLSSLVSTFHNELFKGPNDLDFDAEGNLYFTDPWGTGPGPDAADRTGAVYQNSKDGTLRRIISTGNFPNGIAVSPDDGTLAVADYASNRMLYYSFLQGPNPACSQCARDPSHTTFFFATAGATIPATADLTASTTTCTATCGPRAAWAESSSTIHAASSSATCRCRMATRLPPTLPSAARTTNTSIWRVPSAAPSTSSRHHTPV
jgi:DNA-binding beta-propeller fold protein YncE